MKKIICVLSVIILAVAFASCQKEESVSAKKAQSSTTGVADLMNGKSAEDFDYFESNTTSTTTKKEVKIKTKKTAEADVDMTGLNANMVYSQIYDIMTKPDAYEGKTMKISGVFSAYEAPSTGNIYFSCFVADAAACCQQGLEFELTDNYAYPADYPDEGDEITVYGTFETYMEGANKYCRLKDAVFTK